MIDITKLKQSFDNTFALRQYDKSIVVNDNMIYQDGSNEGFAIGIFEQDGKIMLSDLGITYTKLIERDFDLDNDEDIQLYKNRVLKTFKLMLNDNHELYTYATSEQDLPLALGRLEQGMTLLGYIDLQFEQE